MITGWRHNDLQKSEPKFREEVQKEFERLYNVDPGSKAFDKAVKDALASLLDPKNPNGFGTDGIPGAKGIGGRGSGRDGIDSGSIGKDGRNGGGLNGGDGKGNNGGNGTGGGGSEELRQFDSLNNPDFPNPQTSGFSVLTDVVGTAAGSGLVMDRGGESGFYSPTDGNRIAHAFTSEWSKFPKKNLNETRLFPTSYKFDDWTDVANILATHPEAFDTDGTLRKPYFISDIGADAFGHLTKVKLSNLRDWFVGNPPIDPPTDILEPLRIPNIKQTRNTREYGGLAWYDETTLDLVPDIADAEGKYNGSTKRFIGHGQTSDWTTGRTGPAYDPSKNLYFANHHFYQGDWNAHTRIGTNDNGAINGTPTGTAITPAPYSVIVDLNADSYGHLQYAYTEQLRALYAGRGLHYSLDEANYLPAYEREIGHPQILTIGTLLTPPFSSFATVVDGGTSDYFGNPLIRNTGGSQTVVVDGISYISPKVPTAFWTNDSGHLEAIGWSDLPLIRGSKGDKGDTPVINAYVAATNTIPYGSPANVTVVDVDAGPNGNYAFTFNIPAGQPGTNGINGTNGTNGQSSTIAALINTVTTGVPNVTVTNWGTTLNPIFAFDFVLPPASGGGTGDTYNITNTNTYYNNVQNIGSYEDWKDLVQNPGTNNPIYIKRIAVPFGGELTIQDFADTITIGHGIPSALIANADPDFPYIPYATDDETAAMYTEPFDNGDGTWTFPRLNFNRSGHLIFVGSKVVPIGSGGTSGGSYTWNAATQLATHLVNSGGTVRFLSSDTDKLTITQVGGDITFDVKNDAFQLQPLEFGNGLSQDANAAITPGFNYDPYTGATVHVNNNTKDLAGIVEKGSNAAILTQVTKVYGTDTANNPHWRPTRRVKGDNIFIVVEVDPSDPNVDIIRFIGN